MKPIATAVATADVGPCPFCGRSLLCDMDRYTLLHGLPACAEFDKTDDSLAFMIRCREERERQAGAGPCADLVAFIDGELEVARASAFRAHLGRCQPCQRGVLEGIQLGVRLSRPITAKHIYAACVHVDRCLICGFPESHDLHNIDAVTP
jgi:hypothetical protein